MIDRPLFSVVIPTFNRRDAVLRAVQSVLTQSIDDLEVIVVDDHSADDTREVLARIEDERLKVLQTGAASGGPAAPRNVGVYASRGRYVALLDSDDMWLPDHLSASHDQLVSGHPLCCGNAMVVTSEGVELGLAFRERPSEFGTADLLRTNWIITSTVVASAEMLKRVIPFPPSSRHDLYEDLAVWLTASLLAPWRSVPGAHVKYCDPTTSATPADHYSRRYPHHATSMVNTMTAVRQTPAYRESSRLEARLQLAAFSLRWRAHGLARQVLGGGWT